jgi:hypothetical protein
MGEYDASEAATTVRVASRQTLQHAREPDTGQNGYKAHTETTVSKPIAA